MNNFASARVAGGALALLVAAGLGPQSASAQVVDDSACPKYAVDIASFATCEGDTVVGSDKVARVSSPQRAPALKPPRGRAVVLIDECGADHVAGPRAPSAIDAIVPPDAKERSDGMGDTARRADCEVLPAVRDPIAALGGDADMRVLLICQGNEQALVGLLRPSGCTSIRVLDGAPGDDAIRPALSPYKAGERRQPRD